MIEFIIFLQVVIVIGGPLFLIHINKRVGSYASEVGKITALSKKIDEVVEQQKQITKATEETKADVAHLAWNKKETQTIKRNKIEEYLELVFESIDKMRADAANTIGGMKLEGGYLPVTLIPKLTTIQMLYLPELKDENKLFTSLISRYDSIYDNFFSAKIDIGVFDKKMADNFSLLGGAMKDISLKSQHIIEVMFES